MTPIKSFKEYSIKNTRRSNMFRFTFPTLRCFERLGVGNENWRKLSFVDKGLFNCASMLVRIILKAESTVRDEIINLRWTTVRVLKGLNGGYET